MKHELKCWHQYFQLTWVGVKTFEIRQNNRDFKERDEVVLKEWAPTQEYLGHEIETGYTGRQIEGVILYVTEFEQKPGWVVFQIAVTNKSEE